MGYSPSERKINMRSNVFKIPLKDSRVSRREAIEGFKTSFFFLLLRIY